MHFSVKNYKNTENNGHLSILFCNFEAKIVILEPN